MAASDTELVAARRARLRAWIQDRFGGKRKEFLEEAASRGHKIDASEVSNLQSGAKSFGEKKAAILEEQAAMPAGYLVKALDPLQGEARAISEPIHSYDKSGSDSQPLRFDQEKLAAAISFVRQLEASYARDFLPESASIVAAAAYKYLELTANPNTIEMTVTFGKMLEAEDERLRKAARSR